jgi:hypothetical protein
MDFKFRLPNAGIISNSKLVKLKNFKADTTHDALKKILYFAYSDLQKNEKINIPRDDFFSKLLRQFQKFKKEKLFGTTKNKEGSLSIKKIAELSGDEKLEFVVKLILDPDNKEVIQSFNEDTKEFLDEIYKEYEKLELGNNEYEEDSESEESQSEEKPKTKEGEYKKMIDKQKEEKETADKRRMQQELKLGGKLPQETYSDMVLQVVNKIASSFLLNNANYKWMGPGTNIKYNIEQNIQPINRLDKLGKKHDLAYITIGHLEHDEKIKKEKEIDKGFLKDIEELIKQLNNEKEKLKPTDKEFILLDNEIKDSIIAIKVMQNKGIVPFSFVGSSEKLTSEEKLDRKIDLEQHMNDDLRKLKFDLQDEENTYSHLNGYQTDLDKLLEDTKYGKFDISIRNNLNKENNNLKSVLKIHNNNLKKIEEELNNFINQELLTPNKKDINTYNELSQKIKELHDFASKNYKSHFENIEPLKKKLQQREYIEPQVIEEEEKKETKKYKENKKQALYRSKAIQIAGIGDLKQSLDLTEEELKEKEKLDENVKKFVKLDSVRYTDKVITGERSMRASVDKRLGADYVELNPEEKERNIAFYSNLNFVKEGFGNGNQQLLPFSYKGWKSKNKLFDVYKTKEMMQYSGKLNVGNMYCQPINAPTYQMRLMKETLMTPQTQVNQKLFPVNPYSESNKIGEPIIMSNERQNNFYYSNGSNYDKKHSSLYFNNFVNNGLKL